MEMGATWFFPPFRNMFKLLKELKVELGEQFMKGYIMYESDRASQPSKVMTSATKTILTIICVFVELLNRRR